MRAYRCPRNIISSASTPMMGAAKDAPPDMTLASRKAFPSLEAPSVVALNSTEDGTMFFDEDGASEGGRRIGGMPNRDAHVGRKRAVCRMWWLPAIVPQHSSVAWGCMSDRQYMGRVTMRRAVRTPGTRATEKKRGRRKDKSCEKN